MRPGLAIASVAGFVIAGIGLGALLFFGVIDQVLWVVVFAVTLIALIGGIITGVFGIILPIFGRSAAMRRSRRRRLPHPTAMLTNADEETTMPLDGEYLPSTSGWARRQAERYEATDGREANDLQGRPVIILTSVGATSGMLRKTALMRVEHDGVYAVVASLGGAPKHPVWYHNITANPHVELQDLAEKHDYLAAR